MAKEGILANLQRQIDALTAYFQAGCKQPGALLLGLEVEHFVTRLDGTPVEYDRIKYSISSLQRAGDDPIYEEGIYLGYRTALYSMTLCAGCQLKISVSPRSSVRELMMIYESCYTRLCAALAVNDLRAYTLGSHPTRRGDQLQMIPLNRYRILDRYLKNTGGHGGVLLRATASTRVSISYTDEADFVRKFRVASLITPLLALLTDNAPVYEGTPNERYSVRTRIRSDTDPDRFGIFPGLMKDSFGFEPYAGYLLQKPLVVARHGARIVGVGRKSAFEVYPSVLGNSDMEQILSMFFFDVRVGQQIVLCAADSLPPRYVAAYTQLLKTIFSSPAIQEGVLRRYSGVDEDQIEAAKLGVCCNGYHAQVYGRAAAGEISWLMAQAKSHAAAPEERRMLEPLCDLAGRHRTLRQAARRE